MNRYQQEYEQAPEARVLTDAQFEQIDNLAPEAFAQLEEEDRARFFSTSKWHAGQRQATSAEGMVIGGKTAAEILAGRNKPA